MTQSKNLENAHSIPTAPRRGAPRLSRRALVALLLPSLLAVGLVLAFLGDAIHVGHHAATREGARPVPSSSRGTPALATIPPATQAPRPSKPSNARN
jgi:hypothetical protein